MHSRLQSLEILDAVKRTLAGATGPRADQPNSVAVAEAIYLSCIASTLLVIAHTLIEKELK